MRINFENIFENGRSVIIGLNNAYYQSHWYKTLCAVYDIDCFTRQIVEDHIWGLQSNVNDWKDDVDQHLYIGNNRSRFELINKIIEISGGYNEEAFSARLVIELSPSESRWCEMSIFDVENEENLFGSILFKGGQVEIYLGDNCMNSELASWIHQILSESYVGYGPRFITIE